MRYITAGALLVALAGGGWGWWQNHRAAGLAANLTDAQTEIARLRAEATARKKIEHAIDQIQRLDGDAVVDWLRNRAGQN